MSAPFLGILFLLQAFSLAGVPPLSGFWGKYLLFFEGFSAGFYGSVAIAAFTSLLTLFSMLKIWNSAFIGDRVALHEESDKSSYLSAAIFTAIAIMIGFFAGQSLDIAMVSGNQLLNPETYIEVSLGSGSKGGV